MTTITRNQAAAVRTWYGHGTGSTDPTDRTRDGVSYHLGHIDDALRALSAR